MSKELKRCPFCGGDAEIHRNESIFSGQYYPAYPNQSYGFRVECEGKCHSMTCWWHTEKEAVTAWNTRTLQPSTEGHEDCIEQPMCVVALCHELEKRGIDTSDWDGEDSPEVIIANCVEVLLQEQKEATLPTYNRKKETVVPKEMTEGQKILIEHFVERFRYPDGAEDGVLIYEMYRSITGESHD